MLVTQAKTICGTEQEGVHKQVVTQGQDGSRSRERRVNGRLGASKRAELPSCLPKDTTQHSQREHSIDNSRNHVAAQAHQPRERYRKGAAQSKHDSHLPQPQSGKQHEKDDALPQSHKSRKACPYDERHDKLLD